MDMLCSSMSLPANSVARPPTVHARFSFERDSFAFRNELYWEYRFDPQTGQTVTVRQDPPPTYAHHCFVMVRSARQFLFHARFDPEQPRLSDYGPLIRQVVRRSAWRSSSVQDRVVIPGYASLRELSVDREPELKASCGGSWQSYFLRSHWRMVMPISRRYQAATARRLTEVVQTGRPPIVHVFRFPQLTINHGLLVFGCSETAGGIDFQVYDPNIPGRATVLHYSHDTREFNLPATHYWPGGRLNVLHVYQHRFF